MAAKNMTERRIRKALEGIDLDGVDIECNSVDVQIMDDERVDWDATKAKGDEIYKVLGSDWRYVFNGSIAFFTYDPYGEVRRACEADLMDQLGPAYEV